MKNNTNKSRFTLDMAADLRTRLKIAAAQKGVTMRQYSLESILRQLDRDDVQVQTSSGFNLRAVNKAKALQKSIFGKRRLTDDSTELIRQSREERASHL
ncbi:MAG: hypothetical protein Q7R34_08075 [Dehalococcoidia bacterium]|nr:hypothetical protein [Dehalococcoidia bacterium]